MKTKFYTDDIINLCDNKHLTVDEIFTYISQKYPNAGKSSIYRNVEDLASQWLLKKISWTWKKTFFEKTKSPHIHLVDEISWEILDFDVNNFPDFWLPKWFKINSYDIKIFWNFS